MIDMGANVGFHSLTAGLFFDKVFAFEPSPETSSALGKNVELSNAYNVKPVALALSDTSGVVELTRNPRNRGGNRICEIPGWSPTNYIVARATLDEWIRDTRPGTISFVKIDVEGHEPNVLAGARQTLNEHRPILFIEMSTVRAAKSILRTLPPFYCPHDPTTLQKLPRTDFSRMATFRDLLFLPGD